MKLRSLITVSRRHALWHTIHKITCLHAVSDSYNEISYPFTISAIVKFLWTVFRVVPFLAKRFIMPRPHSSLEVNQVQDYIFFPEVSFLLCFGSLSEKPYKAYWPITRRATPAILTTSRSGLRALKRSTAISCKFTWLSWKHERLILLLVLWTRLRILIGSATECGSKVCKDKFNVTFACENKELSVYFLSYLIQNHRHVTWWLLLSLHLFDWIRLAALTPARTQISLYSNECCFHIKYTDSLTNAYTFVSNGQVLSNARIDIRHISSVAFNSLP